jgi:hypothetical protein
MISAILIALIASIPAQAEERKLLDCVEVQGTETAELSMKGTIPYFGVFLSFKISQSKNGIFLWHRNDGARRRLARFF